MPKLYIDKLDEDDVEKCGCSISDYGVFDDNTGYCHFYGSHSACEKYINDCNPYPTFAFTVNVYRTNAWGDCSMNGITSNNNRLKACWNTRDIFEEPDPEVAKDCDLIIKADKICGDMKTIRAFVVNKETGKIKKGGMFGGNFVYCSDSRFPKLGDFGEPISVHDRFEN